MKGCFPRPQVQGAGPGTSEILKQRQLPSRGMDPFAKTESGAAWITAGMLQVQALFRETESGPAQPEASWLWNRPCHPGMRIPELPGLG